MNLSRSGPSRSRARQVRVASLLALLVLVLIVALPSAANPVLIPLLGIACAAVLVTSVRWTARGGSRPVAVLAALSALALAGAVVDLTWIETGPAAIPLTGVGLLLVSVIGLVLSTLLPSDRQRPRVQPVS